MSKAAEARGALTWWRAVLAVLFAVMASVAGPCATADAVPSTGADGAVTSNYDHRAPAAKEVSSASTGLASVMVGGIRDRMTVSATLRQALSISGVVVAAKSGDEAFHYTFSQFAGSIERKGLRPGSYATPGGTLSPLQAHIDLARRPNRGLPDALVRMDLAGLRKAGYEIPNPSQVGRSFNMPGGGSEMQFPYAIPPEFLKVIPR